MSNDPTPYVKVNPGDLITADLFNTVQSDVQKDIAQQIKTSIGGITNVKHADDSGTLGGLSTDQLTNQILEKVKAMIPGRTGYQRVFKRLQVGVPNLLKHNLGAAPVVDVYQLDYMQVVCAHGENAADALVEYVNFYVYHATEMNVRGTAPAAQGAAGQTTVSVQLDDPTRPMFRIPFKDMLAEYGVDTTNQNRTLDELVGNFWTAMFTNPANDQFHGEQYCHSPWMEKCCGELRSVKDLCDRGDWENLYFKMLPRKTINYPAVTTGADAQGMLVPSFQPLKMNLQGINTKQQASLPNAPPAPPSPGPTQIEVGHLDLNTAAIMLVADPVPPPNAPPAFQNELPVMIIMKA